ncbi:hypothetical protein COF82_02935 [Bacillus wiedmannii]|uniref:hypothetical protein n=1 Tax=Bacillus TaxID=1386 RepID=UPI000BFD63BF|nr:MULTISPECIES: hypothetical protein [Bacillus]PHF34269.1 hypothetical protein COF82_02935 [Bacillus wiedmannii]
MSEKVTLLGPAGNAQWQEHSIEQGTQHPLSILCLPDAANNLLEGSAKAGYYYYLPKTPLLVKHPNGEPVMSLTLMLTREQDATEENLLPLIKNGMFSFEILFETGTETFEVVTSKGQVTYIKLTKSKLFFELVLLQEDTEKVLASVNVNGENAKAGLSLMLNKSEAADVLSSLDGTVSKISIRIKVSYNVAPQQRKIFLSGSWEKIYNFLRIQPDGGEGFTVDKLRNYFYEMITKGVLSLGAISASEDPQLDAYIKNYLFDNFLQLSTIILKHVNSEEPKYLLQTPPDTKLELIYEQTLSIPNPSDKSIIITTPLETVIGGALNGLDRNKFIHVITSI